LTEYVDSTSGERVINNVFRHEYRVLSTPEKLSMKTVKDRGLDLFNAIIDHVPAGREQSLARTKLEEAVMWAVRGITG
jgi:hypothetical protein